MCPQVVDPQPKAPSAPALVSVDGRSYPLRSAEVRAQAEGGLAFTTLVQEFENPHDEPLEVIYSMPLPADGAVLGYLIRMSDRVIRGEIETREKASEKYMQAIFEGRTAGLLEQDRADTFQQRLGNLPARTNARIEIEVLHPLAFLLGIEDRGPVWEYRFPTVVGVRYEGAPGRVKDADRLDVNRGGGGEIPTRVALELQIADATAAATAAITSPSHELRSMSGADTTRVHLADGARLDRDLVIQWPAGTSEVGVRVVEGAGLKGDEGRYALLTVTPPAVPAAIYHRDVTVLIDASGSMDGAPLIAAKRVVSDLLQSLLEGDRFEVLAFANDVERLTPCLTSATPDAIRDCLRRLDKLHADGCTEMQKAVLEAMSSLRPNSQRQVVLVSDGYIGFEEEIVNSIAAGLPAGVRMHMVGVGAAPNRTLSAGIARAGRGVELFANDESTAMEASRRLLVATVRPVLTDLTIGGTAVVGHAPARPRDIFAGKPLVLAVELRPEGGTLVVGGRLAGKRETWGWRMEVGSEATTKSPLPLGALYGRERIADFESAVVKSGEELEEMIERIALRHRIVSRRTSLVAMAEEPSVDPRAPRRRERLAVELPYGVSAETVGLGGSPGAIRFRSMGTQHVSLDDLDMTFREAAAPFTAIESLNVVWLDAATVVIEFTSPHDGFVLPTADVAFERPFEKSTRLTVDGKNSSPNGPHPAGVIIRLALRVDGDLSWSAGDDSSVSWTVNVKSKQLFGRASQTAYSIVLRTPPPKPEGA